MYFTLPGNALYLHVCFGTDHLRNMYLISSSHLVYRRYRADMVMKISGILSSKKQSVKTKLNVHNDKHR